MRSFYRRHMHPWTGLFIILEADLTRKTARKTSRKTFTSVASFFGSTKRMKMIISVMQADTSNLKRTVPGKFMYHLTVKL